MRCADGDFNGCCGDWNDDDGREAGAREEAGREEAGREEEGREAGCGGRWLERGVAGGVAAAGGVSGAGLAGEAAG